MRMIIVSGQIHIAPGRRAAFLASSRKAVVKARSAAGCRDFVVAADPIEPDRVNVYEEWETESELTAFRGAGPTNELAVDIVSAEVSRHQIAFSGPA
jgi:quinol monooxygenase YgiN